MVPITIIVRGLENEPIDVVKVAASTIDGEKVYFLQTVDKRVASVKERDILIYWENEPSEAMLHSIDRMITAGETELRKRVSKENYTGVEAQ